jgi:RHS repeat-associated protein
MVSSNLSADVREHSGKEKKICSATLFQGEGERDAPAGIGQSNLVSSVEAAVRPWTPHQEIRGCKAAATFFEPFQTYDELGRVVTRGVDQATTNANNVATTFDALGRVTNVTNALASVSPGFQYAYVDQTSRLQTVTYPTGTGLNTTYSYYPSTDAQDFERLKEIKNMAGTTNLSDFQYTYNAVGTIATWQQQTDSSTPTVYTLLYDNADQLISALDTNTQTQALVAKDLYHYDPAGNQLAKTTLSATVAGRFNNLNQLTALTSSPPGLTVAGHTSAPVSSVSVDGVVVAPTNGTNFSATISMPSVTNVVSVVAQPSNSNSTTTQRYRLLVNGGTPTQLTYDANGNVQTDENGYTYQWDALNRLTQVSHASGSCSQFAYDGLSRRVQIVEKNSSGTVTSTKNYLWIGSEIAEERDASNNVTKRFFPQGEQQSGTNYYYTRDHLGSVREMCSSTGSIVARYTYDPYGRTTLVGGSNLATFQYTGDYAHQPSGLDLTVLRAYDTNSARWLSRDPNSRGNINLYEYVDDNPSDEVDRLGLSGANVTVTITPEIYDDETRSMYPNGANVNIHASNCPQKNCTVIFVQIVHSKDIPDRWILDDDPNQGGQGLPPNQKPPYYPWAYPFPGGSDTQDYPEDPNPAEDFWWSYETCAVCKETHEVLGCRKWGFTTKGGKVNNSWVDPQSGPSSNFKKLYH